MHHWLCNTCGGKKITQTQSVQTHVVINGIHEKLTGPPVCNICTQEGKIKYMLPIDAKLIPLGAR